MDWWEEELEKEINRQFPVLKKMQREDEKRKAWEAAGVTLWANPYETIPLYGPMPKTRREQRRLENNF